MPLPIKDVLGILADNLQKREAALPLSGKKASAWARGLEIPSGGQTVIYTGHMYQLVPSINAMATQMAKFEDSWITGFFPLGRTFNKWVNLSAFMAHASPTEQRAYDQILANVARLLKKAGVKFGYLYDKELYTGALLYDEGVDDVFVGHARRVYNLLKQNGVKSVITVDPHTTNMLRSVYPKVIPGYELEVKSYLEVLAERGMEPSNRLEKDLVVHDSCLYARAEGVVEEPRVLLREAGAVIHEPELSGRLTHCCGGPLESLFPKKAHEIASNRVEQLAECAGNVATMCPICMANLGRTAGERLVIRDISQYLVEAY